jgi:uncharacterized phage infection (PIP) family protein YhgE
MPTDTQQTVDDLLADLAAVFDDEPTDDGQPDPEKLDELADRAGELVSSTDHAELLTAVGLGETDEPPESLPAAVASGDPQHVARLRSLLTASKLSTAADDRADGLVDQLQSLAETAQGEPEGATSTGEATGDDAETTTDATGEEIAATETEATEEATGAETAETEDEGDDESSPVRDLLQSQLEETHGLFDQIPDFDELTGGLGEDDEKKTETADENESHEDQSTRKSDGTRWRPGGGRQRTTHSTVPSTGRRDIGRRPGRFSSVRGSTVSKR